MKAWGNPQRPRKRWKDYTRIDEQLKQSGKSISGIRDKRGELFRKMRLIEVEISQMRIKKDHLESADKRALS